ncbi:MAG TPA: radical SAM family heme chaperone HemW [bacterium]
MNGTADRSLGVYIHIPFCRARCLYCRFPARPAGTFTQTKYVENLVKEIGRWFSSDRGWMVDTIYVGGGTPSTLGSADMELLMKKVMANSPMAVEVSYEVNPHPEDINKIAILRKNGVNRLSVGVQSFNDVELGQSGRLHNSDDTRAFLKRCREEGIDNLSADLIHGLPKQTIESFRESLEELIDFGPEHVSLYGLMTESDSRLGELPEALIPSLSLPDGDDQASMYDLAREKMQEAGYIQYEIANFAKPGFECRHNMAYWSGGEFIGFGPGAASYIDGARFKRIYDVNKYLDALDGEKNTIEYFESLSSDRAAAEAVVMGLRKTEGISLNSIETRYGIKLNEIIGDVFSRYHDAGLLDIADDNVRLNDKAYFLSDAIFREIIR